MPPSLTACEGHPREVAFAGLHQTASCADYVLEANDLDSWLIEIPSECHTPSPSMPRIGRVPSLTGIHAQEVGGMPARANRVLASNRDDALGVRR